MKAKGGDTINIVIASHSHMAGGVESALHMLAGKKNFYILNAYEKSDDIEREIEDLIQTMDMSKKTLVFTDLYGGSVNLALTRRMMSNQVMIIAGFNLALILECLYLDDDECNEKMLLDIIEKAKNQMVLVNTQFKKQEDKL